MEEAAFEPDLKEQGPTSQLMGQGTALHTDSLGVSRL